MHMFTYIYIHMYIFIKRDDEFIYQVMVRAMFIYTIQIFTCLYVRIQICIYIKTLHIYIYIDNVFRDGFKNSTKRMYQKIQKYHKKIIFLRIQDI
jgi:hypothetical protein